MHRARSLSLSLALGAALVGRVAHAEPPRTSSLGWVRLPGAETCAGAREIAQAVEQRLGRAVFVSPTQADVVIEGRIEPAAAGAPGFHAHLAVSDAKGIQLGTRDLDIKSGCRAGDEEIALVIALLIDPEAALAPRPPVAAPTPPQVIVERVIISVPAPTPPAPAPPPRGPWRSEIAVAPLLSLGLLPGTGIAASLRGEITPPSLFPFAIGASVFLDARASPPGASSSSAKGATISLAYGMIGVCPLAWESTGTRLRGCADLEIGAVHAVGYGFSLSNGAGQDQPVVQAAIEGRVTQRIVGPLQIGLGLGVSVPFRRARIFFLDEAGQEQELFRMAPVAGRIDAGLGLSFP